MRVCQQSPAWVATAVASAIALWSLGAIWWLATPRAGVCPLVLPAPADCSLVDRQAVGVTWSVMILVAYALVVLIAHARRQRLLTAVGIGVLAAVALIGYRATLY